MKIVVFGLTISSSWGNGHATLWRGLCKGLARLGHRVVFFERDVPYYASARDWQAMPGGDAGREATSKRRKAGRVAASAATPPELVLYDGWEGIAARARCELVGADAAIVTSYCPDALRAADLIFEAGQPVSVFYDLDTPVTLSRLHAGERVPYVGERGLRDYDLVLSYTGGAALEQLRRRLGARNVRALYGHVDPDVHRPAASTASYRADLSWLGTYAVDRQEMLEELFVRAARRQPARKFLLAGAQYPRDFPWTSNVYFIQHLPAGEHAAFFSSSRLTLNVTRAPMAQMGWCPSGRLFEAAACGAALLSDEWPGLNEFYAPDRELLLAGKTDDTLAALARSDQELHRIGRAARERTLDEHTCHRRARVLAETIETARCAPVEPPTQNMSRTNAHEDVCANAYGPLLTDCGPRADTNARGSRSRAAGLSRHAGEGS